MRPHHTFTTSGKLCVEWVVLRCNSVVLVYGIVSCLQPNKSRTHTEHVRFTCETRSETLSGTPRDPPTQRNVHYRT